MPSHRVLVVGVGSIGERHLRCFQATERAELSFVEVNETLRNTIAERYKARAYPSLDAALVDAHDVAVVCTPAHLHIPMATTLAQRGLHLLIEKPLSVSLDGIDTLRQTVADRRVTAGIAYVYRAHPVFAAMREAIVDGRFGAPLEFTFIGGQNFPLFRPAYRQIYYTKHETGGGAIQDALTHVLNAAEWVVGPIDRLAADAQHMALEGVDVEDTVHLIARHGKVMASYSLNQHQSANEMTMTVVCEHGTVRFEAHENRWRWMAEPAQTNQWKDEVFPPMQRDDIFIRQAHAFLDAVDGKAKLLCTLDEGLQTLRVNLAALASARTQRWVTITR